MTYILTIWEYIVVFILAAVPWIEIAVVIPIAILNGLNAILVGIISFFGNLITVLLLVVFIEKYQQWREKRKDGNARQSKRTNRAIGIWNKYGLPGLMLLGPILTGSHIAVLIAFSLGARKQKVILWSIISLGLWAIIITILSYYGIDFLGII